MLKYILLALVVLWLFYSPMVRKLVRGATDTAKTPAPEQAPAMMVSCAHCGAHFPASEAVSVSQSGNTEHFCCKEHMQRGARRAD